MHRTGAALVSMFAALVLASVLLSLFAVAPVWFVVAVVAVVAASLLRCCCCCCRCRCCCFRVAASGSHAKHCS